MARRRGLALVLCAPSGAGKSTLVKRLLEEFPDFSFSVSHTTRSPRTGEEDGRDYRFLDRARFEVLRDEGHYAEWAEVHGNLYGTPVEPVRMEMEKGRDMLFDIDVQGAAQLRESLPEGVYVFILPPSRLELERRLRGRGKDSEVVVAKRLANAREELGQAEGFDHLVVNDDLDRAYDELRAVYLAGRTRPANRPGLVEEVAADWDRETD